MKLRAVWKAEDIRDRIPPEGGVGFVFHATDHGTLDLAFEEPFYVEEELWTHGPFIGSPIFDLNSVIGCHIIAPVPAELWATGHAGIRRFRTEAFEPCLALAEQCNLTHVGLGALVPFATKFGQFGRSKFNGCMTTGHAATVAIIRGMVDRIAEES